MRKQKPIAALKVWRDYQKLLQTHDLPSVWKISFLSQLLLCCKKEKESGFYAPHLAAVQADLHGFLWYAEQVSKKLKRVGSTVKDIVNKAQSGDLNAMCLLIATNPAWLYDKWVQNVIVLRTQVEDRLFFKRLGSAVGNQKMKVFKPITTRKNKRLIAYLEGKRDPFGGAIMLGSKTHEGILNEAIKEGVIDPQQNDVTPEYFHKLLKRYNLTPRLTP